MNRIAGIIVAVVGLLVAVLGALKIVHGVTKLVQTEMSLISKLAIAIKGIFFKKTSDLVSAGEKVFIGGVLGIGVGGKNRCLFG